MDDRLRERIEASQSGKVDLGLTEAEALELRELLADDPRLAADFGRIHAWDAAIGAAFDDSQIEVPDGLAARLKEATSAELEQVSLPSPNPAPPTPNPRFSRRALLALAAGLLIIVSASIVGVLSRSQPIAGLALQQEVEQLPTEELDVAWQPAADYPKIVAPEIRPGRVQRWAQMRIANRQAYVFDLVKPGSARAILIAIPGTHSDLGDSPLPPAPATAGYTIGMWQGTTHVYVLVVKGNADRYRLFLKDAGQITAVLR
jgi:hypothetical protein